MSPHTRSHPGGAPDRIWLKRLGNTVIDLLFPPRCVGCHRFGSWLCDRCLEQVDIIRAPICARCGIPLQAVSTSADAPGEGQSAFCDRCRLDPPQLDGLRACAFHAGPLRDAIHQFKYEDLRVLAAPLGKLMARFWPELAPADLHIHTIVPVPLHRSRERERGYNQAALLAHELAFYLNVPVAEDAVVRTKATAPQVGLDARARQANMQGAFACGKTRLAGQHVLLIDDVCTTGATLEASCAALRQGGAAQIWGYTLARARQAGS